MNCPRCSGYKTFGTTGGQYVDVKMEKNAGQPFDLAFKNKEGWTVYDSPTVYVCPKCGKIEMYAERFAGERSDE